MTGTIVRQNACKIQIEKKEGEAKIVSDERSPDTSDTIQFAQWRDLPISHRSVATGGVGDLGEALRTNGRRCCLWYLLPNKRYISRDNVTCPTYAPRTQW
ncbi:hypothetical protein AVEN_208101-1 [Araneus ventricosus]|uniref:Uncharacterized protein n=1 Tax=Araneus ventricosus TaxID=182803 RepID=A0A4Y2FWT6_ARAVE|nr:hypothetical protein AVEN_208101-1 [Araneus ventricosus]